MIGCVQKSAYGASIGDVIDEVRDSMTSYSWRHNFKVVAFGN